MAIHKYRVREGFRYGANNQHLAGTVLELDDSVAVHAMDKLELAEVPATPAHVPDFKNEFGIEILPELKLIQEEGEETPLEEPAPRQRSKKSGDD